MAARTHFDMFQGVAESGRPFGFDHLRNNFIEWHLKDGKLSVAEIVPDELSEAHGPASETLADANRLAKAENAKPRSLVIGEMQLQTQ